MDSSKGLKAMRRNMKAKELTLGHDDEIDLVVLLKANTDKQLQIRACLVKPVTFLGASSCFSHLSVSMSLFIAIVLFFTLLSLSSARFTGGSEVPIFNVASVVRRHQVQRVYPDCMLLCVRETSMILSSRG